MTSNPVADCMDYMREVGLTWADSKTINLSLSDKPRRYHIEGDKRGSKNGWYRVFNTQSLGIGICFGSWRTDEKYTWFEDNKQETPEEREVARKRVEQLKATAEIRRKKEEAKEAAKHRNSAGKAINIWNNGHPYAPDHPYLVSHHLNQPELREIKLNIRQQVVAPYGDCLLIPLFNKLNQLRNLEFITGSGMKRPVTGGEKKGLFHQLGFRSQRVFVCEGFATGLAIHLGLPWHPIVLCAMAPDRAVCHECQQS